MRLAVGGVMEEETGHGFKHLERSEGVIVDVPSPLDQLLRRDTAEKRTGNLPINEGTVLVLAIT